MKRALIISYYFQQKDDIGAIRLRGLAKYLPSFGWETIIISGTAGKDDGFEVTEVVIDDVLTRWKKMLRLNLDKTLKAQFAIPEHKKKRSLLDYVIKIWEEFFVYPDNNRTWVLPTITKGRDLLNKQHFDAIISSSMPNSVHFVAADLASEFKLPWIADFRDLWTQHHYYHYSRIRKFFEERLECKTLSAASALTTVSQPLANRLHDLHKYKRAISILNGFDPNQINPGIPLTKKFSITYTGVLYKIRQDPEPLFRALRILIDEKKLDPKLIEVNFFGYDREWLMTDVKKYQLQEVVKIYGPISREESILKQRRSQLLLLLTWNDPQEKGIYTGKLFDYLAARRPILSMGFTEGGVVKDLLDQTQAGIHVSNEEELKKCLLTAYSEYMETGALQYRGIDSEVIKYSHLEMARKFAAVLDEVIS
jgi:glycosyltransferase involved in cell wall biosynthesis